MRFRRLLLPLSACLATAAFVTVGGACQYGSSAAPAAPSLQSGQYILTSSGAALPPQVVVTAPDGHRIRVLADSIVFNTTTQQYVEHGSVAITPAGGTEQAPTPIALGTQTLSFTSPATFDMPVTVAGVAHATMLTNSTIDLRMIDGSHWMLTLR